jgi:hypothetical protein
MEPAKKKPEDDEETIDSMSSDGSSSGSESETEEKMEAHVNTVADVVTHIKVPFSCTVVSKRNSGKSFLVRDIVYELSKQGRINQVIVMSNTSGQSLNADYDYMPPAMLMMYKEATILKIMELQQKLVKAGKIREILLVLDDVVGSDTSNSAEGSRLIRSIFANSRHYHISVILLSQIATRLLQPAIRENSDVIFFSRLNRKSLETMSEAVCNIDKKAFVAISEKNNKNYSFIFYNNQTQSNNPQDFLFVVKAKERKFTLGGSKAAEVPGAKKKDVKKTDA